MLLHLRTDQGEVAVKATRGRLLTELCEKAGVVLNTRCGGKGVCKGCRVRLGEGRYLINGEEVRVEAGQTREALACLTRPLSREVVLDIPARSIVERAAKIHDDFTLHRYNHEAQTRKLLLRPEPATLEQPASDLVRIERAIGRGMDAGAACTMPLDLLRRIPAALAEGGPAVTATLGRSGAGWCLLNVEPHDTTGRNFALAADIGTTTVVVMLVDLNQGVILRKASLYNQQIARADDVASRISCCGTAEDLREMQRLVVDRTINVLIGQLCRDTAVRPEEINRLAVSGNTVMAHLFLGLPPDGIGRLPFQPVAHRFGPIRAREVGVAMLPDGLVDVTPSIAGYVGGDITSDIYVARLLDRPEPTLLVDIGTNGEMVYSEDGRMAVCATAAGPAFEGAGVTHGVRAAEGAIERIAFGAGLVARCEVIGNTRPVGLCGSASIDFLAGGLRAGFIGPTGRYDLDLLRRHGRYRWWEDGDGRGSHACVLVDEAESGTGGPLVVTEQDIAQLLKAKAATYAGLKTLLAEQGRTFGDLRRFVLAGGFARHINLPNAILIGLLPEIPLDRFDVIGNGSLAGAFLTLVEPEALPMLQNLAGIPRVVELNLVPAFESNFVDALAMPNLDEADFPQSAAEVAGGAQAG